MRSAVVVLVLAFGLSAGAQDLGPAPASLPPAAKQSDGHRFQLLPKSFVSDPLVEMTVYSELTDYGRTLPEVSPERPAYYLAQNQGFQPMGSSPGGDHPPTQEQIDRLLQGVLQKRGFLPTKDSAPAPTLALFYYWGVHSGIDLREIFENPDHAHLRNRDLMERARLVGGKAFAETIKQELALGVLPGQRSPRDEHLRYQIEHDLYYVVVSAYDYGQLTQGERHLAWRTTLTVNTEGVSLTDTLPPLIASAADFLGRDTGRSVALQRRINRGSVTLGPLIIVGEAPPDQVPAKAK